MVNLTFTLFGAIFDSCMSDGNVKTGIGLFLSSHGSDDAALAQNRFTVLSNLSSIPNSTFQ